jgi:phosphoenolpyruvate carboxykinase (GTP)
MADYWAHWLEIGRRAGAKLPNIYYVNWFRKSDGGDFLWPGFGENSRVLKWVYERCEGSAKAIETPIGNLPAAGQLELDGLDIDDDDMAALLRVDVDGWLNELPLIRKYYEKFGSHLPKALLDELDAMRERLEADE